MYELATDAEIGIIYTLMEDGVVKVYDAAGPLGGGGGGGSRTDGSNEGSALWTSQLITHDPSPRSLGTDARSEYRQWRESIGLDKPVSTQQGRCTGKDSPNPACSRKTGSMVKMRIAK